MIVPELLARGLRGWGRGNASDFVRRVNATFSVAVLHVLTLSAKEKVRRVDTQAVVALVTNVKVAGHIFLESLI